MAKKVDAGVLNATGDDRFGEIGGSGGLVGSEGEFVVTVVGLGVLIETLLLGVVDQSDIGGVGSDDLGALGKCVAGV